MMAHNMDYQQAWAMADPLGLVVPVEGLGQTGTGTGGQAGAGGTYGSTNPQFGSGGRHLLDFSYALGQVGPYQSAAPPPPGVGPFQSAIPDWLAKQMADEGKPFPWLLVGGGVAAAGVLGYFLLGRKRKR